MIDENTKEYLLSVLTALGNGDRQGDIDKAKTEWKERVSKRLAERRRQLDHRMQDFLAELGKDDLLRLAKFTRDEIKNREIKESVTPETFPRQAHRPRDIDTPQGRAKIATVCAFHELLIKKLGLTRNLSDEVVAIVLDLSSRQVQRIRLEYCATNAENPS